MLGEHIRRCRLEKGITGSELARRVGVSRSLISQIERGTSSPSVEVLQRIAATLDIQIGTLFDGASGIDPSVGSVLAPTPSPLRARVVRRNERKVLSLPASQVRYELLSPDLQGRLEFVWMEVAPGGVVWWRGFSHEGEESVLMVRGTAHFQYGDHYFVLEEGDTITFDSSVSHHLINPGDSTVVAISAGTPPSF